MDERVNYHYNGEIDSITGRFRLTLILDSLSPEGDAVVKLIGQGILTVLKQKDFYKPFIDESRRVYFSKN